MAPQSEAQHDESHAVFVLSLLKTVLGASQLHQSKNQDQVRQVSENMRLSTIHPPRPGFARARCCSGCSDVLPRGTRKK